MNDVYVGDEKLISTTRASELSGYSKDYIGQLCREDKIECRRISGHWYIDEESLTAYQKPSTVENTTNTDEQSQEKKPYGIKVGNVRDDTFMYDGVEYIATSRAADLTGYAQDYIGQLARNGEVAARKVGRRWFIGRKSLLEHKKKSDAMLATVQAQAAGFGVEHASSEVEAESIESNNESEDTEIEINKNVEPGDIHFNVRYVAEGDKELMPRVPERKSDSREYANDDISSFPQHAVFSARSKPSRLDQNAVIEEKHNETESRKARKALVRESRESTFRPLSPVKKKKRMPIVLFIVLFFIVIASGAAYYVYQFGVPSTDVPKQLKRFLPVEQLREAQDAFGGFVPGREVEYQSVK